MRYRTRPRVAYLAGRFERKEELREAEVVLSEHNILPGTRWLHVETDMRGAETTKKREWAVMDFEDVLNADMLVAFSEDLEDPFGPGNEHLITWGENDEVYAPAIWARGGRHVEFGIALGQGISIAVIGPHENLFHYFDTRPPEQTDPDDAQIVHFATLDEFVNWYDEHNVLPEDAELPNNESKPESE